MPGATRTSRLVAEWTLKTADARRRGALAATVRRLAFPKKSPLPAYWWTGHPNFGDQMAPAILAWMTGAHPSRVEASFRGKVLSLGSVLKGRVQPSDTIWGSGSIRDERLTLPASATVLAVRGPHTRSVVEGVEVPPVYGDPAMLLPRFYAPPRPERKVSVGVVPHYVDQKVMRSDDPAVRVIDVTAAWQDVVNQITTCDVIVSSSLHGIIVAEAYGIPAAWTRATNKILGGNFKFNDYYASTDRGPYDPVPWTAGLAAAVASAQPAGVLDLEPLIAAGRSILESQPPGHS